MGIRKIVFNVVNVVLAVVIVTAAGCDQRQQYGKYTEEQMAQMPFANKYELPAPSGNSMVLSVFSETITSDEILGLCENILRPGAAQMPNEAFTPQARPIVHDAVKGKITDIMLYQQARKNAPESIDEMLDKAVDTEVTKFVADYGNNYALAENKIKEMGYDWRTFREYQKKLLLTQSYLSSQLKSEKRFSHQQLREYYEQNKQEQFSEKGKVGFSVIEIRPEELLSSQIQEGESLQSAAERIAAEVMKRLKEEAGDFAATAKAYHGMLAAAGGRVLPVEPGAGTLPEPYNTLEGHAVQMEAGQITDPIKIDGAIFIVRLDEYTAGGSRSFHEVQQLIERRLLFEYQQKQYFELVDQLILKTDLAEMDRFIEFCVKQAYGRWGRDR